MTQKRHLPPQEVTVYCGSGPGDDPAFVQSGHDLGEILSREGIRGRFGGGSVGIMGAFGSAMIGHGGYLTAVIPQSLVEREQPISNCPHVHHDNYTLIVTSDMYERKRRFRDSCAFVVLGGGAGTRDELWEELTALQIGEHKKPIVLVNTKDCFKYVLADIDLMRRQKFVRPGLDFNGLFAVVDCVGAVVPTLRQMLGVTNVVDLQRHAS